MPFKPAWAYPEEFSMTIAIVKNAAKAWAVLALLACCFMRDFSDSEDVSWDPPRTLGLRHNCQRHHTANLTRTDN